MTADCCREKECFSVRLSFLEKNIRNIYMAFNHGIFNFTHTCFNFTHTCIAIIMAANSRIPSIFKVRVFRTYHICPIKE